MMNEKRRKKIKCWKWRIKQHKSKALTSEYVIRDEKRMNFEEEEEEEIKGKNDKKLKEE